MGLLQQRKPDIAGWVRNGLTIAKIEVLLTRSGKSVPYRTLHGFATEQCGFRLRDTTLRMLDGYPGVECQIDFAQMGVIDDPQTGRRRKVHALIFTAVFSRHLFVHFTYSRTLAEVIVGREAGWVFVTGVLKVLIPDNLKPVVTAADAVDPRLSVGWLHCSQHAGFVTDPARVRTPQDKPMVERAVQYVRNNFFAGETFTDLRQAQTASTAWCTRSAEMRVHCRPPAGGVQRAGTGCIAAGAGPL